MVDGAKAVISFCILSRPCNSKGIMSYGDKLERWSSCSVSDFTGYYNSQNWGNTCMKDWDPKSNCADICPGSSCLVSDTQICSNKANYGGCNGRYKQYFDKYCKKTCGICGDGASTGSGSIHVLLIKNSFMALFKVSH